MIRPGLTTVVSLTPSATDPRPLGQYGRLSAPTYSFTVPGGCEALSTVFWKPPRYRTSALDVGRMIRGYRGGSIVWEGYLDSPAPEDNDWKLTAHGAGGEAVQWRAINGGAWNTGMPDRVVNDAIARGLRWVNPGIGAPAGMWTGQQADEPSLSIADVLNLVTTKGGLTWVVRTLPRGNILSVVPVAAGDNRILVVDTPLARSATAGPTTLYVRYQTAWDNTAGSVNTPAAYSWLSVTPSSRRELNQGRAEDWVNIGSAGVRSSGEATTVGNNAMAQFQASAFTTAIPFRYGTLLTLGGQPVDPGVYFEPPSPFYQARLLAADYAPPSDSDPGMPSVLIGGYEWNDETMQGIATPFASLRHDFTSLMSMITTTIPVRTAPKTKK